MSEKDIDKDEKVTEQDDVAADETVVDKPTDEVDATDEAETDDGIADADAQPVEFSIVYDEDDDADIAFAPAAIDETDAIMDDTEGDAAQVAVSGETATAGESDAAGAGEPDANAEVSNGDTDRPTNTTDTTDTTEDKAADANPRETSAAATAANARHVSETLALATKNATLDAAADLNEVKASVNRSERALDQQVGDRVLLKSYPTFSLNHATTTNRKTGRHVLDNVSIACYAGSMYAIRVLPDEDDPEQRVTLMEVLGGYQLPTSGTAMTKSSNLVELEINELRGHRFGIVPQRYAVRGDLDAEANVRYAMDASGRTYLKPKPVIARELLERVGFSEATSGRPVGELPLVEQRRVAIARAISCEADVVIIDEPTKGLDDDGAAAILELLASIAHARDPKRTVIIVTASDEVTAAADQTFHLAD